MSDIWSREFWIAVRKRQSQEQRYGQAVFNTAYDLFPREVDFFRSTSYDPFFLDSRVDEFLAAVEARITNPDK
jgi:hypothetical protein